LQYVHDNGFVHGHIQPSNILAIGDRVKLSSDAMVGRRESGPGGPPPRPYHPPEAATGAASTASDVWQLGMMLIEVLTQRAPVFDAQENKQPAVPDGIPQPFREIIENCLRVDPARRWTVTQIADRLEGRQPEAPSPARAAAPITAPITTPASLPSPEREKRSAKWPYALAAIVAVSIVVFLIARPKPSESTSDVQSTPAQPSVAAGSAQSAQTATQSEPKQSPAAPPETKAEKTVPASGDDRKSANADTASTGKSDVVKRVIPEVSAAARRTINGTVRVRVAVSVDPAGNVTSAEIEAGQTSKYFDRLALEAARNWKFSPAQAGGQSGEKERNLQFAFSRAKTEAFVVSAKR
jgi:TonB family protein